jgi:hypothetical protein
MGEPWRGTTGGPPRDAALRAAADALVRAAPDGTRLLLRRFRESLVPADASPRELLLRSGARTDATDAVGELPSPGGSTAFVPVLAEAFDVLAHRTETRRSAILLTDGQSAEDVTAVGDAVDRLIRAGIGVAVVVPGTLDAGMRQAALLRACDGRAVRVVDAGDPARLGETLTEAERTLRGAGEVVRAASLEAAAGAAPVVLAIDVPPRIEEFPRRFAAPDATVLVRTVAGVEFAAIRPEGAGRVAATAGEVPSADGIAGDHGAALVRALVRAVRRRGSAGLRVRADEGEVELRFDVDPPSVPHAVRVMRRHAEAGTVLLRREPGGVFRAASPLLRDADAVAVVDDRGTEVAAAGLDRPAPRELDDVEPLDTAALARRLAPASPPAPTPLRAPLAALAALLLVAGSVKSGARPAR